ncbi:MAG: DDE-type integrase/transposase/recombinase [Clostridiales Family XIII bacterium]|nr:DDE-type integrase/transposase/recombinase [Clostridiales Family XIII bacterium]
MDVFARRIVGYRVSTRMNRNMVAAAFRMAVFSRMKEGRDDFSNLMHHNDKDSQYTSDNFAESLALHGVRASMGSVGDSYDNALARASTAHTKRNTGLGKATGNLTSRRQGGCIGTTRNASVNGIITCHRRKLKIYGIPGALTQENSRKTKFRNSPQNSVRFRRR